MSKTIQGENQVEALQGLMDDIVRGAKLKLVEPVLDENRKLVQLLADQHSKDLQEFEEIRLSLRQLEEAVRSTPMLVLAALREAINRAGMDQKA